MPATFLEERFARKAPNPSQKTRKTLKLKIENILLRGGAQKSTFFKNKKGEMELLTISTRWDTYFPIFFKKYLLFMQNRKKTEKRQIH